MRQAPKLVILVLGAGLPARLVAARIGEAEEIAEAARGGGRAVPARRVVALAAENVLADRLVTGNWPHLPTLLAPATVLLAAGTAALALTSPGSPQTYAVQAPAVALLAVALVCARHCPLRALAALAVVLAAALAYELPGTLAAGLSSYRQGSRVLATDVAGTVALLVAAAAMPLGLVPLAVTHHRLTWTGLGELVRGSRWLRWTWRVSAGALAVLATAALSGAIADPVAPVPVRAALAVDGLGLIVASLSIVATASVRGLGRGETARTAGTEAAG